MSNVNAEYQFCYLPTLFHICDSKDSYSGLRSAIRHSLQGNTGTLYQFKVTRMYSQIQVPTPIPRVGAWICQHYTRKPNHYRLLPYFLHSLKILPLRTIFFAEIYVTECQYWWTGVTLVLVEEYNQSGSCPCKRGSNGGAWRSCSATTNDYYKAPYFSWNNALSPNQTFRIPTAIFRRTLILTETVQRYKNRPQTYLQLVKGKAFTLQAQRVPGS